MALNKGKHTVTEIEGIRCSVIETGLTESRAHFLKEILENNGLEVKTEKEKTKEGTPLDTLILGVTDILFNAVISVYGHRLKRKDGVEVSPAYWNQWPVNTEIPYWMVTL
jgi:hypothetical protein